MLTSLETHCCRRSVEPLNRLHALAQLQRCQYDPKGVECCHISPRQHRPKVSRGFRYRWEMDESTQVCYELEQQPHQLHRFYSRANIVRLRAAPEYCFESRELKPQFSFRNFDIDRPIPTSDRTFFYGVGERKVLSTGHGI